MRLEPEREFLAVINLCRISPILIANQLLESMRARFTGEDLRYYANFQPTDVPQRIGDQQVIKTAEGRAGIDNLIEELRILVHKSNQTKKDRYIMRPYRWATELNFMLGDEDVYTNILSEGTEALRTYLVSKSVEFINVWMFEVLRGDSGAILTFEQAAKMLIDDGGSEEIATFRLDK